MKESREAAENEERKKKARRRKLIKDWCIGIAVTVATLSAVGICAYFLYWLVTTKGT
jgi:formate-dependent nitrite reductase membrane component NrfD